MIRRLLDLSLAAVALALASPVIAAAAITVKLTSPGPAFYRGARIGRHGQPFDVFKLRTMRVGTAASGPGITAGDDPRITTVGRMLRKWKLDELPQLLNVVRGEMALVGPRPEDARYVETYTAEQRRILDFRPGLTGAASVEFRDEESILAGAQDLDEAYREIMAHKIDLDLAYMDSRTLRSDLGVLWKTATAVLR